MYPYLTPDIPGIGGVFKESPEDFLVTEIPLYEPCGTGEHSYLFFEKRGITTLEAIHRIAKAIGVQQRDIGYAGMKDAKGITRQTLSIPRVAPDILMALKISGITMLSAKLHNNKLRLGHLAGNRFSIRIREVSKNSVESATAIASVLSRVGIPNYFGEQRYGVQGNSAEVGCKLLQKDYEGAVKAIIGMPDSVSDDRWQKAIIAFHEGDLQKSLELFLSHCRTEMEITRTMIRFPGKWDRGIKSINPRLIKLYLSACQSDLFDRVVAARMPDINNIIKGDVAYKHINGACFRVDDEKDGAIRSESFEISATGPMFGTKMLIPEFVPGEIEDRILADSGLTREMFNDSRDLPGERRPLRVPVSDLRISLEVDSLLLEFSLPKGAYATSLLREIMKSW